MELPSCHSCPFLPSAPGGSYHRSQLFQAPVSRHVYPAGRSLDSSVSLCRTSQRNRRNDGAPLHEDPSTFFILLPIHHNRLFPHIILSVTKMLGAPILLLLALVGLLAPCQAYWMGEIARTSQATFDERLLVIILTSSRSGQSTFCNERLQGLPERQRLRRKG